MHFLIHFEDGSSGYLSHHGTKGMKWGKWNEETRARYTKAGKTNLTAGGYSDDEEDEYQKKAQEIVESGKHAGTAVEEISDAAGSAAEAGKRFLEENNIRNPYVDAASWAYQHSPLSDAVDQGLEDAKNAAVQGERRARTAYELSQLADATSEDAKERKRRELRARNDVAAEIADKNRRDHAMDVGWYADRIFNHGGKLATAEEIDAEIENRKKRGEWNY